MTIADSWCVRADRLCFGAALPGQNAHHRASGANARGGIAALVGGMEIQKGAGIGRKHPRTSIVLLCGGGDGRWLFTQEELWGFEPLTS